MVGWLGSIEARRQRELKVGVLLSKWCRKRGAYGKENFNGLNEKRRAGLQVRKCEDDDRAGLVLQLIYKSCGLTG